jgi:hypothetical protein
MTSIPVVELAANQRLNFSMGFVGSTSNWEALNLNMTIDDENMAPHPSYLQIPQPNATLPAYITYDNDDEVSVSVINSGTTGIWLTYQGSRVTFDNLATTTAYAGIAKSVNGTLIDVNTDSLLISPGYFAKVNFTQPKSAPTNSTGTVDLIPPGTYKAYVFLQGYDETGQFFLRTKNIGAVTVVD